MSEEENQKTEEQLRRYAQGRREAGGEWDIPPVTAKMLRAESERRWGRRRVGGRFRVLPGGWLPWGLAFGVGLVLGLIWSVQDTRKASRVARLELAEEERLADAQQAAEKPALESRQTERKLLGDLSRSTMSNDLSLEKGRSPLSSSSGMGPDRERLLERRDELKREPDSNAVAVTGQRYSLHLESAPPAAPVPALSVPAGPVPAPAPAGKPLASLSLAANAAPRARSYSPGATTWFFRREGAEAAVEQRPSSTPDASSPPAAQARLLDRTAKAESLADAAKDRDSGFIPAAQSVGGGTLGIGAMAADKLAASNAAPGQIKASARGALGFVAGAKNFANPGFRVLDSFSLTRQGNVVTITDSDGSVYDGFVESGQSTAAAEPALARPSQETAAHPINGIVTNDKTASSANSPVAGGRFANLSNGILSNGMDQGDLVAPGPAPKTLFRVTGTNNSTGLEVAFEGYLAAGESELKKQSPGLITSGLRNTVGGGSSGPPIRGSGGGGGFGGGGASGGLGARGLAWVTSAPGSPDTNAATADGRSASPAIVAGLVALGRTNQMIIRASAPAK